MGSDGSRADTSVRSAGRRPCDEFVDEPAESLDDRGVQVGPLPTDAGDHLFDRARLDVAPHAVLEVFGDQLGVLRPELSVDERLQNLADLVAAR
jgi:hypothetical protein